MTFDLNGLVDAQEPHHSDGGPQSDIFPVPGVSKRCSKCQAVKALDGFTRNCCAADGLEIYCRDCRSAAKKAYYQENRVSEKGRAMRWQRANRARINARKKEWNKENPDLVRAKYARYRAKYPEKNRLKMVKWAKKYPERRRAQSNARQKWQRRATPPWARTGEVMRRIQQIYLNRPEGHHVDHIVPLKGKDVSGLHVPWNLQYLPAKENAKKHNKVQVQLLDTSVISDILSCSKLT